MQELNIIDENDHIVGKDTRENIHKNGLLHREIHVWVYNQNGEILFQRRSKTKDTFPNLLDASVGGHVEIGDDYLTSAIKELEEETGIKAKTKDLIHIAKMRKTSNDEVTGTINNVIRKIYAYEFCGDARNLKLEKGKATSLEFWKIDRILHMDDKEKKEFIASVVDEEYMAIFKKIKSLSEKK
jgi:isopentenyl-diphosphate delta-isomerase type 1